MIAGPLLVAFIVAQKPPQTFYFRYQVMRAEEFVAKCILNFSLTVVYKYIAVLLD